MKELLAVISLVLSGAVAEAPAPYPPSGFRPNGPAFELPQKVSQNTNTQPQEYLPPVDPRIPSTEYGFPEEDVSVQGLPTLEQQPIFQVSPISGQQYTGPNFNTDIKNLDESYRQNQYQIQQEQYREFERQRQLEAAQARARANQLPAPQGPRQFATEATTTEATTSNPDFRTTEATTTESFDLNEGETLDDDRDDKKEKVSVEVSKQNVQEYPGELFLSSLAQLQLQPQFVPFGQIRAPLYFQPLQQESQKQVAGYDAATHFAALPSVLAQQQLLQGVQGQAFLNPAFQQQLVVSGQESNVGFVPQNPQPFNQVQYQPAQAAQTPQFNGQFQPAQPALQVAVQPQYAQPNLAQNFPQTVQAQNAQTDSQANEEDEDRKNDQQPQFVYQQSYQPQEVVYQPQYQPQPAQFQPQPAQFQPQQAQYQPQPAQYPQDAAQLTPQQQGFQPQFVYQGVPQQAPASQYQPQEQQNVFLQAPEGQYVQQQQGFLPQAQLVNYPSPAQQYQNGFAPQQFTQPQFPQQINQGQDALQSGLDLNQQGNGVEENGEEEPEESGKNDAPTSVAVATAFGARTQPRVATRYGAPVPRTSADPQTTAEPANEEAEDSGAVAEANAFAGRRKSAKLRSRRVRPIFTLDRSGHLVLASQQN